MENLIYWMPVIQIALLILQGLLTLAVWAMKKQFVSRSELEALNEKIGKVEKSAAAHRCINQSAIHQLNVTTTRLDGQIETVSQLLSRTEHTLRRQENYLLNGGTQ